MSSGETKYFTFNFIVVPLTIGRALSETVLTDDFRIYWPTATVFANTIIETTTQAKIS